MKEVIRTRTMYKDEEWDKPRTFRDRKTKKKDEPRDHPLHEPYYREHKNWTKEAQDAEDIFRDDE